MTVNEILDKAFKEDSFDTLTAEMRKSGNSCIYLMGARVDHKWFLKSKNVALGISVLPEDMNKSIKPGYHHGKEVIVVTEGSIVIEYLVEENSKPKLITESLEELGIKEVIENQCHRIYSHPNQKATFVFLKTAPHSTKGVIRCSSCEKKYKDICPLRNKGVMQNGLSVHIELTKNRV